MALKYLAPILLKQCHQRSELRFVNPVHGTRASVNFVANLISSKRVVYFGEIHGVASIVRMQERVLDLLVHQMRADNEATGAVPGKVVVVMEHFAGPEHQTILNQFMVEKGTSDAPFERFVQSYRDVGNEGHDLLPYADLFRLARDNADVVEIKAGFIPRSYARSIVQDGYEVGLEAAYRDGYLDPATPYVPGSDHHYNFFESLISGRDLTGSLGTPPDDRFRKIFPAQVVKDAAMARVVTDQVRACPSNRLLVICGAGHCEYRFGVPERVDVTDALPKDASCVISTRDADHYEIDWKDEESEEETPLLNAPFERVEAFGTQLPADLIFFYTNGEASEMDGNTSAAAVTSPEAVKADIADAYDEVSKTAHLTGDSALARSVLKFLDYDDDDIAVAGNDAFNYQGVGNPHKHARVAVGERVLDIGSGLGVDSFIAAAKVGPTGRVTGVDISKGEVVHASKRARARGLDNVGFVNADMERLPLEDGSVDVVISNGAFCLAPDKEKAFKEIYRVLRPGGRFSVACTTLLKELPSDVHWPICMRVFMPLRDANPLLTGIGFVDVFVDDTNSLMVYEMEVGDDVVGPSSGSPTDVLPAVSNGVETRKKIHVGSDEFKHLANFDMNELCARVVLYGRKP